VAGFSRYHFATTSTPPQRDKLNVVQIEQDVELCKHKYPRLICRPIAAQFMEDGRIVLFEFAETDDEIRMVCEKHYRLVPPDALTEKDLEEYKKSASIENL
jgi:hypothetical protein